MPAAQVADGAPGAQALDQDHRRQLEELHGKGHRRQQADGEIAGAEFHQKASQKHSGSERAHGFAGERVVEDQPECPLGVSRFHRVSLTAGPPRFRPPAGPLSGGLRTRRVTGRRSGRPADGDPKRLVAAEFMRLAVYVKRHRLACFQRRFDKLLGLVDPDLEAAATPLKPEAEAAPVSRQLRVEPYASRSAVTALRNRTLPSSQIPPRAAMCTPPSIATWVSARSIAARLPEVAQRHFGVAQSRGDEPMHGVAQRAAMAAPRLVVIGSSPLPSRQ